MINNNRQNGRRRGRNGQPPRGGQNGSGSRVDNRARGNAPQLYEKYKTLARDAQMQGDRVNTEYYLQFADHYFRVLSENRSRFEEQRRPRDEDGGDEFGAEPVQRGYPPRDEAGADEGWIGEDEDRADGPAEFRREQRAEMPRDDGRRPDASRNVVPQGDGRRNDGQGRDGSRAPRGLQRAAERASAGGAEPPAPAPMREPIVLDEPAAAQIEFDRVPPAIAAEPAAIDPVEASGGDAAPVKRRRPRKRPAADSADA